MGEMKYLDYEGLVLFKLKLDSLRLSDKADIVEALNGVISDIGNGKLTITVNNTPIAEFTANQIGSTDANISVPTTLSDLNNAILDIKNIIKYGQSDVSDLSDEQKETLHNLTAENSGLVSESALETALAGYGNTINYDSASQKVQLKHGNTVLSEFSAADFIKDSMIQNISVTDGTGDNLGLKVLLIDFNSDSGVTDIEIPISEFFNPDNYYTKNDFATVATTGDYGDLINRPGVLTLEEVNTGTDTTGKLITARIVKDTVNNALYGGGSTTGTVITTSNLASEVLSAGFAKSVQVGNNTPTIADVNGVLFVPEQVQANWNESLTSSKAYIQNKPIVYTLAEILNIIKYGQPDVSDLTNELKEAAEDAQALASGYVKSSDLATVATTGNYGDLLNTPDVYTKTEVDNKITASGIFDSSLYYTKSDINNIIPNGVNDGLITFKTGAGLTISSFSANLSTNSSDVTVYNSTEIINLAKYGLANPSNLLILDIELSGSYSITENDVNTLISNALGTLSTVATTGSYTDLTDKPSIPNEQIQSDWNLTTTSAKDYIKNKPTVYSDVEIKNIIKYGQSDISGLTAQEILNLLSSSEYALKSDLPSASDWNSKLDVISDLETIRTNAASGAAKVSNVLSDWNATLGLAVILNKPTIIENYSDLIYTAPTTLPTISGGTLSIDGSKNIYKVTTSASISGVTLTAVPENYHSCHIIIKGTGSVSSVAVNNGVNITINNLTYTLKCPDNAAYSITLTSGKYIEFDILRIDNELFVRGI